MKKTQLNWQKKQWQEFKDGKRTAAEPPVPRKMDIAEARILKMLKGWSVQDIECLLHNRVITKAKELAKYDPKHRGIMR